MRPMRLQTRLMVVVGIVTTAIATVAVGAITYLSYYQSEHLLEQEMGQQTRGIVVNHLTVRGGEIGLQAQDGGEMLVQELREGNLSLIIENVEGVSVARYGIYRNLNEEEIRKFLPNLVIGRVTEQKSGYYVDVESEEHGRYDTYTLPLYDGEQVVGYLQVAKLNEIWPILTKAMWNSLIVLIPLVWLVAGLLASWAVRATLTPLERLVSYVEGMKIDGRTKNLLVPKNIPVDVAALTRGFDRLIEKVNKRVEEERATAENISHELKTPLTRISVRLQNVARELPQEIRGRVKEINREVVELGRNVESLLTLMTEEESNEEAWELLPLVTKLVERTGEKKKVRISGGKQVRITGPKAAIRIAVGNLVSNALKYGEGQVKISMKSDNTGWLIEVQNMSQQKIANVEKLTERYYRTDGRGHGLGLAIVESVCKKWGWELRVLQEENGEVVASIRGER